MHGVPSRNIRPHKPQCSRAVLAHHKSKGLAASEDWFNHDEAEKRVFEKYDRREDLPQLREKFFLEKEGMSHGKIPCEAPGDYDDLTDRRQVLSRAMIRQDERLAHGNVSGFEKRADCKKADRAHAATVKGCHIAVEEKFGEQNFPVLSEMRILAKIRGAILDFVGYVVFL